MAFAYDGFRWEGALASDWRWPAGGVLVYLLVTQLMLMFVERNKKQLYVFFPQTVNCWGS